MDPDALRLSVLDQSPIPDGADAAAALRTTVALAQAADRLNYTRYWLAEHHNTLGLAGSSPEVLVATVAAATERIRVGSGGVMLPHYSALKVAETFKVLSALHPGRIDLGIGRAPGGDPLSAYALRRPDHQEPFPQQVQQLMGWLDGGLAANHPYARVRATPLPPKPPEVWLLGSSDYSANAAAAFGTAFSFAHFINPSVGLQAVAEYRERFEPSDALQAPQVNVGVAAIVADTEAEAERLASSVGLWRLRLERGDPGPVPSVEEALAYPYSAIERARLEQNRQRLVVGAPEQVRDQLVELATAYRADELVILTITHDQQARIRSYELLAEAFGLPARPR